MQSPLALLLYEKVLPGGQLVGRLEDLGYRVKSITEAQELVSAAEQHKPMLLIADFEPRTEAVARAVSSLKQNSATAHIPVIALVSSRNPASENAARTAKVNLVVQSNVILQHLPQFLDQALALE